MFRNRVWIVMGVLLVAGVSALQAAPVATELVDTLTVDAFGTVSSSVPLASGVQYWLLASGTFEHNNWWNPPQLADAEYWHNGSYNWVDGPIDLLVNGVDIDWLGSPLANPDPFDDYDTYVAGQYSGSHTYWYPIIGDGSTVEFWTSDTNTGDNGGYLDVSVYTPEPTTLGMLLIGALGLVRRR